MVGDAVGDAEGLLLAIDRLGRTIVALERQNAELETKVQELESLLSGTGGEGRQ